MKKLFAVFAVLSFMLLSAPSNGYCVIVSSLVDDWSNSSNANGPWSYNEGNNALPVNVANWPVGEFGAAQTAWAPSNTSGIFLPGWFKSVATPGGGYDWLAGDVVVHSTDPGNGSSSGVANVTWTNPVSGTYDISGGLWMGRDISRSNDWKLFLDNLLLDSGSLASGDIYSRISPDTFVLDNLFINQGSVLKLEVFKTSGAGDFVGVNFDIHQTGEIIPEPSTMILMGLGLAFVGFRRKYKK